MPTRNQHGAVRAPGQRLYVYVGIWFTVREDGLICDVCLETGVSPVYEGELRGELLEDVFEKLI